MKKLFTLLVVLVCFHAGLSASTSQGLQNFLETKELKCADCAGKTQSFNHKIRLQLSDSLGFPVPGTEFWVTLKIIKEGPRVTIKVPVINFETGPTAGNPLEISSLLPGGYLYTADGFLPQDVRPNEIMNLSYLVASNNGASLPFSLAQSPATLPVPPVAYILQVTNAGALVVQCAGTFGNIIPPGPQILLPTEISYTVGRRERLCENIKLSTGKTNITKFTNPVAAGNGIRDSHVNDAFDGVVAWAWSDNSTVVDKTNGTTNLMVAIGRTDKEGKLKARKPIQLTDLPAEFAIFDTAVAINRTDKNNIIVSYSVIDNDSPPGSIPYRAVSFDGGKTWPENGPLNFQTGNPSRVGDVRGVASDKFGNIWYSATNLFDGSGHEIAQPVFAVSVDKGVTFEVVYTAPPPANIPNEIYDYPQYCFGGDGLGNYGLWFVADYVKLLSFDFIQTVGFIPIMGFDQFGSGETLILSSFINVNELSNVSASSDGRVWIQGSPITIYADSYIQPLGLLFKSPGPIDQNYAGVWQFGMVNGETLNYFVGNVISYPAVGYLNNSIQSIVYDEQRQALYALFVNQYPDYSQNMRIYFIISRDNGQTWSNPIDISTTKFANRGYQSMALDPVKGNLVFGWYDGRHDPTFESLEYFAAAIPAKKLDELVEQIPLSNPLYTLPSAALSTPSNRSP